MRPFAPNTPLPHLQELYDKYVAKLIAYVLEGDLGRGDSDGAVEEPLSLVIPISNLGLLRQLTVLLDAVRVLCAAAPLRAPQRSHHLPSRPIQTLTAETEYDDYDVLEGHFIFALTWSIGAAVVGKDRPRFNAFLQAVAEITTSKGIIYDSFFDAESRRWVEWSTVVPDYAPPAPFEFARVLVPTTDYVLYSSLLSRLAAVEKPVLFVGESGTAKTVTVQNFLAGLNPEKNSVLNVNFSSRTSSEWRGLGG